MAIAMAVTKTKRSTPLRGVALALSLAGAAACGGVDEPVASADGAPPTVSNPSLDGGIEPGEDDITTADAGGGADLDAGATRDGGSGGDAGLPGDEPDACPS